ncbi:MAG: peptidoglycan DD-metalloendopeptidase family protein [Bacteroidales bacterium]|nr:peptidoglycan DD-metalloendopeptidase family protein [Bacteroidales bacterium]MCF8326662.1 peptidoglycan DD-metalloendopeptidase family protein [Bacteroidales bacterium]
MPHAIVKYCFIILIFYGILSVPLYAQDKKEELKEKKKKIEQDIRYTNKLLSETKENKKTTLSQLNLINRQINSREQLIHTINSEVEYLKRQIGDNESEINDLNQELKELKEEYARMIYHAYKIKSRYHKMMFIFSAESFDQAYRRIRYLRQYNDFRRKQAELIQEKKQSINTKIAQLKEDTERKVNLLARKEQERQKLKHEKKGQNNVIEELKDRENQLRRELRQKQAQARELEKEIERIIAAEMAKASEKTTETSSTPEFKLTPEQVALSDDFTSNKGKLPWPTKRGQISSTFGRHAHRKLRGIQEINNGITISTSPNARAIAVFGGRVTKVISIGNKKAVLIQHGDYFTLYDNLTVVEVSPGNQVETGDVIGTVKTDNSSGETEINFQIWRAKSRGQPEKLDPQNWILSR